LSRDGQMVRSGDFPIPNGENSQNLVDRKATNCAM
jgi:hypothetical protein